jgi:hypothetical protein
MKMHKWQRKDAWVSDEINGSGQAAVTPPQRP